MATRVTGGALAAALILLGGSSLPAALQPDQKAEADAIEAFTSGVDTYVALHRRLERHTPREVITSDPARIEAASRILAVSIRAARPDARQGDIFTPEIAQVFRGRIVKALEGKDVAGLLMDMAEETPAEGVPPPQVHARFPVEGSHTVPPVLLHALLTLPEELNYRFIGRDLVLLDLHADLIVDFLPDAILPDSPSGSGRSPGRP